MTATLHSYHCEPQCARPGIREETVAQASVRVNLRPHEIITKPCQTGNTVTQQQIIIAICMYVIFYVFTYVHMHVCAYVFRYVHVHVCMYICMYHGMHEFSAGEIRASMG